MWLGAAARAGLTLMPDCWRARAGVRSRWSTTRSRGVAPGTFGALPRHSRRVSGRRSREFLLHAVGRDAAHRCRTLVAHACGRAGAVPRSASSCSARACGSTPRRCWRKSCSSAPSPQTVATGTTVKPWSWADTWPVARIEVPRLEQERDRARTAAAARRSRSGPAMWSSRRRPARAAPRSMRRTATRISPSSPMSAWATRSASRAATAPRSAFA